MCTSCELYRYYYTNAIFQENQEDLETKLFSGMKGCYCSNIVSDLFSPTSTVTHFSGSTFVHILSFEQMLLHKCNFPGKQERVRK